MWGEIRRLLWLTNYVLGHLKVTQPKKERNEKKFTINKIIKIDSILLNGQISLMHLINEIMVQLRGKKFIFYYFISEIIIKSPFLAASSSLPFISIARIALTATASTTTMKREKISLEGNFYFIFYFYENGAAEWR